MSVDKNRVEADRWLRTATDDLDTAAILQKNKKFAHSVYNEEDANTCIKYAGKIIDAVQEFLKFN